MIRPDKIAAHAVYRFAERWAAQLGLAGADDVQMFLRCGVGVPSATHPARTALMRFTTLLDEKLATATFVENEAGTHQQIWITVDGILLVVLRDTVMTVLPPGATRPNRRPQR